MTTSTPIYPDNLPDVWSYQGVPVDQVLRTTVSSSGNGSTEPTAPIAYRNRSRVPGANTQVSWTFLEGEYKIFVSWWRDILLTGHKWFWIKLPSAGGLTWMICRFSDTNFTTTQAGHRYYQVTANIEIRERAFSPQALPFIDIDISAMLNVSTGDKTDGVLIENLDAGRVYTVTLRAGGLYTAWSAYPSDASAHAAGKAHPWLTYLEVSAVPLDDTYTQTMSGAYGSGFDADTPQEAFDKFPGGSFTGRSSYYVWLHDDNPGDDRGGLSIRIQ